MSESLPPRPNLNWLKNRAKEKLREMRLENPAAKLSAAQLVVARDYGFSSWRELAAHVKKSQPPAVSANDSLLDEFRKGINRGDVDGVRRLFETQTLIRESVNAPVFGFDSRPMHQAKNNREMVDLLLKFGADINLKSAWWAGPWGILETVDNETADFLISRGAIVDIFAAAHLNRLDRLRELLDADPKLANAKGGDGCRPLHFARSPQMIDLLLERGADIEARDVDHEGTPVQWVMPSPPGWGTRQQADRDAAAVRHFLSRGAQADIFLVTAVNDADRLAAILKNQPALVGIRVAGPDYPQCPVAPGKHIYAYRVGEGATSFQIATAFESKDCLSLLLSHSTPQHRLLIACATADEPTARDELAKMPGGIAALSQGDQRQLSDSAGAGNSPAVKLMLDLGFDPLAQKLGSFAPALHCAAHQGWADVVQTILDHPRTQPLRRQLLDTKELMFKSTPLDWCCHGSLNVRNKAGDYPRVAKLLLDAGATPSPNPTASAAVLAVLPLKSSS